MWLNIVVTATIHSNNAYARYNAIADVNRQMAFLRNDTFDFNTLLTAGWKTAIVLLDTLQRTYCDTLETPKRRLKISMTRPVELSERHYCVFKTFYLITFRGFRVKLRNLLRIRGACENMLEERRKLQRRDVEITR